MTDEAKPVAYHYSNPFNARTHLSTERYEGGLGPDTIITPLYAHPPVAPVAGVALDRAIDAYISDYIFEGDEGPYQPTSADQMMFSDLLHGWESERQAVAPVADVQAFVDGLRWNAMPIHVHELRTLVAAAITAWEAKK